MEYRSLGRTGIQVSPLCLGAMMFGGWGEPDHDTSITTIHAALDAGINFIDTADVYSQGESEIIVGKAWRAAGATTWCWPRSSMARWAFRPRRRRHRGRSQQARQLAALDRPRGGEQPAPAEHRLDRPVPGAPPDPDTDIEETLSALTDLQRQGKIRAFGSSTFPAHQMVQAQWVSERRGLGRFVTEQPPYSLLVRGIEADVLPVAQEYGMGVLPWSPLAGGWLTGGYRKDKELPESRRRSRMPARYDMSSPDNQRKLDAADALGQLADDAGLSLIHLALAFVLQHPAVTAPIIGPRTLDHLKSQLGAAEVTLSTDILDKIDEIVPPGSTVLEPSTGYQPPALTDPFLRRRRTA